MNETTGSVEARNSPYFGLEYYEEKFGAWFFGREGDASRISTNLRAARLTLLHADSGVGKSSLLRAGVAWRMQRLADDSFARRGTVRSVPIVFISWKDNPVQELVGAIRVAIRPYLAGRPEPELPADRLDTAIERASDALDASLLIMLDQFEEYFLYRSGEPVREQFADELARCVSRTDLRANFLIAIREEAYAGLGDLFKGRIANVYGNYLHIDYLDRVAAELAIRKPLDVYNSQPWIREPVTIEDRLVEAVLDQVRAFGSDGESAQGRQAANGGADGRVATPLLQLVMESIWEQEDLDRTHELSYSTLQNLRGVDMIVDAHLEKALGALSGAERRTAIDVFDHLVTASGGKIAQSVPDLADRTSHGEEQVGSVLDKLDHDRIVRSVAAAPGKDPTRFRRYEIFHDVLAPSINRAIAAAREVQRRMRRLRRAAAVGGVLLIVVLAVVGASAWAFGRVIAERTAAEWDQLTAYAEGNVSTNPELSAALAVQAMQHQRDMSQAEGVLRAALPKLQAAKTFQDGPTIFSVAFDPADPNKLASADNDGVGWIWDVETGHRVGPLSLGGFSVSGSAAAVAFNPAGTEVAVGYADGQVALFNARTGKKLSASVDIPSANPNSASSPGINSIAFVGNTGKLVIATQQDVDLWHSQNGLQGVDTLSKEPAKTVAADPANPRKFAVATTDGAAIWTLSNSGTLQQQRPLGPPGVSVNDAEFSHYGNLVVTADNAGNVNVYNSASSAQVMTLQAGEAEALSAAFSRDGQQIVAGYASGTTRVWDVPSRLPLTLLEGNTGAVDTVRFSPAGNEVATAGADGVIRVWDSWPSELQYEFTDSSAGGVPSPVGLVGYLSAGRVLSVDEAGHLYVSAPSGGQRALVNPGGVANAVAWNREGTELIAAEADDTVHVWRAVGTAYTPVQLPSPIHVPGGPAEDVEMAPDGSRILVVNNDEYTIQVLSARTGRPVLTSLSATNAVVLGAFSPSGQILTGDFNGQVEVWDSDGGHHRVLGTPGPAINDIDSNATGSEFVTVSDSGVVTIWATRDDQPVSSIKNACPSPNTASFSPDGSKIVVACGDGTIRVYDAATGQMLISWQATSVGNVSYAGFSPDGKYIVASVYAGNTGSVQVWKTELATSSVSALERFAEQRIIIQLTPAQVQGYLTGASE